MKPEVFIFDIDGTIANCSHRLIFIDGSLGVKDYDVFYDACDKDEPIDSVLLLIESLVDSGEYVIFVTGRPEICRKKTEQWLEENAPMCCLTRPAVYMRKDGDHRPDYQVKREIYETQIKDKYDVIGVFEDRDQCVQMWRELGLQCYQVNNGGY